MPTPKPYLDFDLAIQKGNDTYRARVINSPGGEANAEFVLPFDETVIENLLLKMGHARRPMRGMDSAKITAAKKFGGGLFQAVFVGDIFKCWQSSLTLAETNGNGLRVRLRLNDAPELADLPWEFLYEESLDRFFNHSTETPLVRFLELPAPPRPLPVAPPLKILVMISLPRDVANLDADQEWKNLNTALQGLIKNGIVSLERSDEATMLALQKKLRQGEYHILHFIGHGDFDENNNESVLLMEDASGHARSITGQQLGTLLHDHRTLRLVLLNACEGARSGRQDPFSGVAQNLIRQGIPSVVAMQFSISDDAALILSREFYNALADNYPIDAALSEARKALYLDGNEVEWATPVLYLRAPDGVIFDVQRAPIVAPPQTKPKDAKPKRRRDIDPKTTAEMLKIADAFAAQQANKADAFEFNPIGRWDIQVQDMVGTRLNVEFLQNGSFQMMEQIGMFQTPISGSWTYNSLTRQLALQGVVNTFQPLIMALTIGGSIQNGFSATGNDGVGYVLTRGA